MGALRLYTCYKDNVSFRTTKSAPKCNRCGKTLKGKKISSAGGYNRRY